MTFDFKKAAADLANHFTDNIVKVGYRAIADGYMLERGNGDYLNYMKEIAAREVGVSASSIEGAVNIETRETQEGPWFPSSTNKLIEAEMFVIKKSDYDKMCDMIRALSKELDRDRYENMASFNPEVVSPVIAKPYPAPRINNVLRLNSREHLKG